MDTALTRRLWIALLSAIALFALSLARRRRSHATSDPEPKATRHEGVVAARELEGLTRDELYARARAEDLPGRSKMNKAELQRALATSLSR